MSKQTIVPEKEKKQFRAAYKRELSNLQENTKNIREKIVKINQKPQSLEFWGLRNKLIRFFQRQEFRQLCNTCQGNCCGPNVYKGTRLGELFYFLSLPPSVERFNWPEPDWQFLESKIEQRKDRNWETNSYRFYLYLPKCLFLGQRGCLLGQWRPEICLLHRCSQMKNIMNEHQRNYLDVISDQMLEKANRTGFSMGSGCIRQLTDEIWTNEKLFAWFRV